MPGFSGWDTQWERPSDFLLFLLISKSFRSTFWLQFYLPQYMRKLWSSSTVWTRKWKWKLLSCLTLQSHRLSPWNSPGQNTGVGSLFLSPGNLWPRDQTQVSHIAGGFFTSWATREAQNPGVGSLSLLQWIFQTQELNQGLPALQAGSLPAELWGKLLKP